MKPIQEHDLLPIGEYDEKYDHLRLIEWKQSMDKKTWGYYATYKIGAEWIDDDDYVVVTTKKKMENIDFLGMFMTCFSSDLAIESFSNIYTIDWDKKSINAPALKSIVSPLIVLHFISVVSRIAKLKRGYVHYNENLKKVKGHIDIMKNERINLSVKRYDHIYCKYDEYTEDIPENRLLKKALLFSKKMIQTMEGRNRSYDKLRMMLAKSLSMFEGVSDEVQLSEVRQIKTHKLFKEYTEAIRLAKLILRHFDYSIKNVNEISNEVVPFTLDMSLLYEHYVYGLLDEAYPGCISYQAKGKTGYPDFLYKSDSYRAILDTKYIPKYEQEDLETYVIRQLCGYSRDLALLRKLGYDVDENTNTMEIPPCVIIYPIEDENNLIGMNPFCNSTLADLCDEQKGFLRFYKIVVPLPTIK